MTSSLITPSRVVSLIGLPEYVQPRPTATITGYVGLACSTIEPTMGNGHWAHTPKFGDVDHSQRWRCST